MVLIVEDNLTVGTTEARDVCFTEDKAIDIINEKNENEGIGSEKRYRYLLDY